MSLRMVRWVLLAIALLVFVALIAPQQLPVILTKLCMVAIGIIGGYWADRELFPYGRPDRFDHDTGDISKRNDYLLAACMIRRAIIVFAVVLGVTLGL